jgi:hypothetical protein
MTSPGWIKDALVDVFAVILLAAAVMAGWTAQGWRKDRIIKELQATAAKADLTAAQTLQQETQKARNKEAALQQQHQARETQLTQEKHHAQTERDRYLAGLRSGAIRVSVPVIPGSCAAAGPDPAAVTASRHEARAELDPAAAQFLDDIAGEGDDAIRQLNACIDHYNAARETFNVQAQKPAQAPH